MVWRGRSDKPKAGIGAHFEGRELSENEQAVVDVFSGKADYTKLNVGGHVVVMCQGNESNAGTKHSVYRHYGTGVGSVTTDDILLIPSVIENGERTEKAARLLINWNRTVLLYRAD